jgi:hypothetical protein
MTEAHDKVDERLERLAQATAGLRARPGFTDRVLLAARASAPPGWLESVTLSARAGLAVAVLAVAAAFAVAVQSDLEVTEASAVAYGAMEIPW